MKTEKLSSRTQALFSILVTHVASQVALIDTAFNAENGESFVVMLEYKETLASPIKPLREQSKI